MKAVDDWFNVVTSDTREVNLATADPRDVHPAAANLVAGEKIFSVTNTTATSSGVNHQVNATSTDNLLALVPSKIYTVNGLAASQLIVMIPGQTHLPGTQGTAAEAFAGSGSVVAGTQFNATVMAVDTYYNIDATVTGGGSTVTLALSNGTDSNVVLPSSTAFSNGVAVMPMTHKTTGGVFRLTPTSSPVLTARTTANYAVTPAAVNKFIVVMPGETHVPGTASCTGGITGSASQQTVGTSVMATVLAVDTLCNVVTNYDADVNVTSADPDDTDPGVVTMDNGYREVYIYPRRSTESGVTHAVTAAWDAGPGANITTGVSSNYTVVAGIADKLAFTVNPSASALTGAALAQQPSVQVQDFYGNRVTGSTVAISLDHYSDNLCSNRIFANSFVVGSSNPVNAVAGNASFTGVTQQKIVDFYLGATAAGDFSRHALDQSRLLRVGPPRSSLLFRVINGWMRAKEILTMLLSIP